MKKLPLKILVCFFALLITGYVVTEVFGGKILTAFFDKKISPAKLTISDIDLSPLKGKISLHKIELRRKNDSRIFFIKTFELVPRWKDNNIFFKALRMNDSQFLFSAADIPENVKKRSEPIKIKPAFGEISVKNLQVKIIGVKGLEGDRHLTIRDINGLVNCQGEVFCLKNKFELKGIPIKGSLTNFKGSSDVRAIKKVHVKGAIKNVRLNVFNSVLTDASPVYAESGRVDLYTEYKLLGPGGEGYLKFFIKNLELKENEKTSAGFLSRVAGDIVSDRKIKEFDLRVPVKVTNNKFKIERVDIKKEIVRIYEGKKLSKGFDKKMQAQEDSSR